MENIRNINRRIKNIQRLFGQAVTDLAYVQDLSSGLIIEAGRKNSGTFRTLSALNKHRIKKGLPTFSKSEYDREIKTVLKLANKKRLTVKGEKRFLRRNYIEIIKDSLRKVGKHALGKADRLTLDQAKNIVKVASIWAQIGQSRGFDEHVAKLIDFAEVK